jgi:hypothetical protein
MTLLRAAFALAAAAVATPAAAQLSNRSLALESGLSTGVGPGGPARAAFAIGATAWLEGPLEAVARVRYGAGQRTSGRGADALFAGTVGLRASLLPDPPRPQLEVEVGWSRRVAADGTVADRAAAAASVGLEWFPSRDVSISVRAGYRWLAAALSAEAVAGVAAYF